MAKIGIETIMGLILNSGEAKSLAMEAIAAAKTGDFSLADEKVAASHQAMIEAHHAQTSLLTQEAQGDTLELSLLAVHSQDHLMTSITFLDLAKEIINLYRVK